MMPYLVLLYAEEEEAVAFLQCQLECLEVHTFLFYSVSPTQNGGCAQKRTPSS